MTDTLLADLYIRVELPRDIPAVREVNLAAFGRTAEADLVGNLRENAKFVLSLVAVLGDRVVGHILFTDMLGSPQRLAGLAPMAVLPEFQHAGIGSALVRAGLDYLREQSFAGAVVLGHKDYYPRFGFRPAAEFGFTTQFDVPAEYLLVAQLSEIPLAPGNVRYQPEFETVAP